MEAAVDKRRSVGLSRTGFGRSSGWSSDQRGKCLAVTLVFYTTRTRRVEPRRQAQEPPVELIGTRDLGRLYQWVRTVPAGLGRT
jgi:hypothetical protein